MAHGTTPTAAPAPRILGHRAGMVAAAFPSKRDPGAEYIAVCVAGRAECSCAGFRYRRECKHTEALKLIAAELGRADRDISAPPASQTRRLA